MRLPRFSLRSLLLSVGVAAILMGGAREGIRSHQRYQARQLEAYWRRAMDYHARRKKSWLLRAATAAGQEAATYRNEAAKEADLEQICRNQF